MHSSYPWNAFMGLDRKELRPAEDPNRFDLFLDRGRIPVKTWKNEILGFVCVLWGLGGFASRVTRREASEPSGGRFARLHVFGVATGPLRMCVVVCMHDITF